MHKNHFVTHHPGKRQTNITNKRTSQMEVKQMRTVITQATFSTNNDLIGPMERWKTLLVEHILMFAPPLTQRGVWFGRQRQIREVEELENLVASWDHRVCRSTIRCHLHANWLHEKAARTKKKTFLNATSTRDYRKFVKWHFWLGFEPDALKWCNENKGLSWCRNPVSLAFEDLERFYGSTYRDVRV